MQNLKRLKFFLMISLFQRELSVFWIRVKLIPFTHLCFGLVCFLNQIETDSYDSRAVWFGLVSESEWNWFLWFVCFVFGIIFKCILLILLLLGLFGFLNQNEIDSLDSFPPLVWFAFLNQTEIDSFDSFDLWFVFTLHIIKRSKELKGMSEWAARL